MIGVRKKPQRCPARQSALKATTRLFTAVFLNSMITENGGIYYER